VAEVHRLTQVSSTLDVIHEYAARGAPHGTAVVAEEQLAGRGSRGRSWHSPVGGFWYSILLRDAAADEALSLRVGLAVARAIEAVAPEARIAIKWPNDLMLGERKVGGVLCEARWQGALLGWIAVGLGINVRNRVPEEVALTGTTLSSVAPALEPAGLVGPITAALRSLRAGQTGLSAEELAEFGRRDWLRGKEIVEPAVGIVDGIGQDGSLTVLDSGNQPVHLRSGHVVLR
jgi:BirA family biotin operon repressor/biotin-[acetyl-CoA-carboxylase] ligase